MLSFRRNNGRILEPSCGNGRFSNLLPDAVAIEIDATICPDYALNMDFFDYPITEKFDTIIGNPPFVRYQDIPHSTISKFNSVMFDERSNLYLFFIEKCIDHLNDGGELIFITPRDFMKATSSLDLNDYIYERGTITDLIDFGDKKIFNKFSPNCIVWRFEKGNFSRKTNNNEHFLNINGQLIVSEKTYNKSFSDYFFVKVGAVSGLDYAFESDEFGNLDFITSSTVKTGKLQKMIYNYPHKHLLQYKDQLINRKIKKFNESNWWMWGRLLYKSNQKRIYVNCKTRTKNPFFLNECNNYDGSILGIFPRNQDADLVLLKDKLNNVDWGDLGFMCGDRYIFSSRSLENTVLPNDF